MVISDRIKTVIQSSLLTGTNTLQDFNPFQMFNFSRCHVLFSEIHCGYMLALSHAIWQHATIGQLNVVPT